jgi:hypothetical protein
MEGYGMAGRNTQFISIPELCREQFEAEEEFLFHQSICRRLAQSLEDSMKPDAVSYTHEEVWGRLREKYGV